MTAAAPARVPIAMPGAVPVRGEWCDITHGFWEGGAYVRAGDLEPGDVYRYRTLSGYVVESVRRLRPAPGWDGPRVVITFPGGWQAIHAADTLVERFTPGGPS